MRACVQRVSKASVSVAGQVIGEISRGLVILVGVQEQDNAKTAEFMAQKIINLRIFEDSAGKSNLSALDVAADLLAISQFTLYADCKRGRRPSFIKAAAPEVSEPVFEQFVHYLKESGLKVAQGEFGAMMLVKIFNDGPVTIFLDSDELRS